MHFVCAKFSLPSHLILRGDGGFQLLEIHESKNCRAVLLHEIEHSLLTGMPREGRGMQGTESKCCSVQPNRNQRRSMIAS